MRQSLFLLLLLSVTLLGKGVVAADATELSSSQVRFFEERIRPVLVKHCYPCHSAGAKKLRAGLRLDRREGLRKGGKSGAVIVSGQPEKSRLLSALRYESLEMPPTGRLSRQVAVDFEKWIRMGAPDPRVDPDENAAEEHDGELWSFRPVVKPALPERAGETRPYTDVDRFVLAALENAKLEPVPNAEPGKLIRRLYLDLTGLPPSPDAIDRWREHSRESRGGSRTSDEFLSQETVIAIADELLATPQYGERWARHWLDTARYAESNGNNRNRVLRYAWRYRNWVIDAVRTDKPYDRFLKEQLAGDLMPAATRAQRDQQRIATGFLAVGSKPYYPTIVPFDPDEPDRARFDWAAEQINATMTGMLALTVGCARCHDHKFDPIPTRDYYALAGIFRSTNPRFGMYWDLFGVDEGQAQRDFLYDWNLLVLNDEVLDSIRPLQARYKPLVIEQNRIDLRKRHWPQQIERMEERLDTSDSLSPELIADLKKRIAERKEQLARDEKRIVEVHEEKRRLRESFSFRVDQAMGVEDAEKPSDVHVRIGGEHATRGELVPRGFLSTISFEGAPVSINPEQSGRLELADWIAHPGNPLTARVAVNRIWYHLFGRGLVETLDNFGIAGEVPTHPRLLDHLAHRFVHDFGWSRARLIRYLVSSRVYQLDSAETFATTAHRDTDPQNALYWRMSARRLEAEAIRDSMLAVSGKLDLERPTGSPLVEFEYYADIRHGDRQRALGMLAGDSRTIYVPTLRGHRHKLYELFDYPDDEVVTSARSTGSVPTQALFLMNNPLVMDYATALAQRLQSEGVETPSDRLDRIYRLCYGRAPTRAEIASDLSFLENQSATANEREAWSRLAHSMLISAEFLFRP